MLAASSPEALVFLGVLSQEDQLRVGVRFSNVEPFKDLKELV